MTTSQMEARSVSQQRIAESGVETEESRWNWLYKVGGIAALIIAVCIPIQIIVFMAWPPPTTVLGYFTLFANNKLIGLLDLDLLIITDNILGILILLGLYLALRRAYPSVMAAALILGLVATSAYFAANTSFNMLSLSDQYAAATTDAQRSILLAAGQAMLAIYNGTAFHVNYVLGSISLVVISVVMLRTSVFSKATAYVGILANVIAFGLYIPTIGIYISIFSVLFLEIWYILIARKFFQLGRVESQTLQPVLSH